MKERRNFYRILGVQPDADEPVIRMAYRTWMQRLGVHPDRGGDTALAATVNAAYRILRDSHRRAAYDRNLRRQWNRRELAGVRTRRAPAAPGDADTGVNRRNYYRVLGVQQSVPAAVIDAAYRAQRAGGIAESDLVEEAYEVLGDENRRAQYDAWLSRTGHPAAARAVASQPQFCLFCKTPHGEYPGTTRTPRCFNCTAPLQPVQTPPGDGDRDYARCATDTPVRVFESWPPRELEAQLAEVTPNGLALSLPAAIDAGAIVRLEAPAFAAVAAVVHTRRAGNGYRCGLQLLTASFVAAGLLVDEMS